MSTPPADLLARMLASDPGRPRVTFYEDTPGHSQGERIELSAKVLANWVNKAANALQEEWDLGVGSTVRIALPPHWRSLYWALAAWSVGATVVLDDEPADLLVTDDPEAAGAASCPVVVVTLAALARTAAAPLPADAMDEARELSTYGDQFLALDEPAPGGPAAVAPGRTTAYEDVVPRPDWPTGTRVHVAGGDLGRLLELALAAWAVDGSVVLSRGSAPAGGRADRLATEGVTLDESDA
ncbi:TIGR03089 family protein [Phycicoccus ginsengisoli]